MFNHHEIEERFGHTKASIEDKHDQKTEETHEAIRRRFIDLAADLDSLVPDGRQKTKAFEELETAAMWFHKGLARS